MQTQSPAAQRRHALPFTQPESEEAAEIRRRFQLRVIGARMCRRIEAVLARRALHH